MLVLLVMLVVYQDIFVTLRVANSVRLITARRPIGFGMSQTTVRARGVARSTTPVLHTWRTAIFCILGPRKAVRMVENRIRSPRRKSSKEADTA